MRHQQFEPHPILADLVKCLWVSEADFSPPNTSIEILPDSYIELIFGFGAPIHTERDGERQLLPTCFVVGLLDQPFSLSADGFVVTIAARFYAWGFYPLISLGLTTRPDPIGGLGPEWHALGAGMEQAALRGDRDQAVELLHAFLIERALRTRFDPNLLQAAASELLREQGQIKIGELADRCNLSQRQLQRRFSETVRTSPKVVSQLLRFQQARDALWRDPDLDLAPLALACGYADQAHLSRDFRRFAERTPRQFAAEMRATRSLLQATGVAFVQDA